MKNLIVIVKIKLLITYILITLFNTFSDDVKTPLLIPSRVFPGDIARAVFSYESENPDFDPSMVEIKNVLDNDDYDILSISARKEDNKIQIIVTIQPWQSGNIITRPFSAGEVVMPPFRIKVESVLDTYDTELPGLRNPLVFPGTRLEFIKVILIAVLIIAVIIIMIFRKSGLNDFMMQKLKKIASRHEYKRLLIKIRRYESGNERLFWDKLAMGLRKFISIQLCLPVYAMTPREIASIHDAPINPDSKNNVVQILLAADRARFGNERIDKENNCIEINTALSNAGMLLRKIKKGDIYVI